jgi:4-hydroxy-tetrahydrodipicolinate reductase
LKIALFGQGATGRLIQGEARSRGHEIGAIFASRDAVLGIDVLTERLGGHDVALDFSVGDAVLRHVSACAAAGIPLVEGTTDWADDKQQVRWIIDEVSGAMVYGSNFSMATLLFSRVVSDAAKHFAR